jgi:hypothetical protein
VAQASRVQPEKKRTAADFVWNPVPPPPSAPTVT